MSDKLLLGHNDKTRLKDIKTFNASLVIKQIIFIEKIIHIEKVILAHAALNSASKRIYKR